MSTVDHHRPSAHYRRNAAISGETPGNHADVQAYVTPDHVRREADNLVREAMLPQYRAAGLKPLDRALMVAVDTQRRLIDDGMTDQAAHVSNVVDELLSREPSPVVVERLGLNGWDEFYDGEPDEDDIPPHTDNVGYDDHGEPLPLPVPRSRPEFNERWTMLTPMEKAVSSVILSTAGLFGVGTVAAITSAIVTWLS